MNNSSWDDLRNLLATTQKKLTEVESVAKIGTWELSLDSRELTWSDQMFKIFDRKVEDGHPKFEEIHDKIHFADRFHWELLINKVSIDGAASDIVVRLFDDVESVKWIRKTARGVFENNKLVAIRGFCQDITELKRLETHYDLTKDILE